MSPHNASRPTAPGGVLTAGTRLGRYEIVSLLGAGTMGQVYRARDIPHTSEIALKILLRTAQLESTRLTRFVREARLLALVRHPNIALILGVEDFSIGPALVLELVEGPTLAERIADGAMPLAPALSIAWQLAAALEATHATGVIHRDLKPANVMVTSQGLVKLVDFGVATMIAEEDEQRGSETMARHGIGTEAGGIVGTPAYMSPEQTRGECVDQRTDVWAFGCVLYELLTGARAFDGETVFDTFAAIREREPDLRRLHSSVPACTRELLRVCLEKDVNRRVRDVADVRTAIEAARQVIEGSSQRWTRRFRQEDRRRCSQQTPRFRRLRFSMSSHVIADTRSLVLRRTKPVTLILNGKLR